MNDLLQAALTYADLGYKVFPANGKIPLTPHGLKDATDDPDQIIAWWEKWPEANIALSTEGLFVLDVDGEDNEWYKGLSRKQLEDLSHCPTQRTPRGGYHFFFVQPPGKKIRSRNNVAPKVDIKADGGYVIVAPSKGYQWIPEHEL